MDALKLLKESFHPWCWVPEHASHLLCYGFIDLVYNINSGVLWWCFFSPLIVLLFWLIGLLVISLSCSIFSRTLDQTAPILTRSWSPQRVRMKVCGNMSISGMFKESYTTVAVFVVLFWKSLRSELWHTIWQYARYRKSEVSVGFRDGSTSN